MLHTLLDVVLHLDLHLAAWSASLGSAIYLLLFGIVFCETGLVATPFLPGDSLLFAVGALAAVPGSGVSVAVALPLLAFAAVAGDAANYKLGQVFGERAFRGDFRFVNRRHLERARDFYDHYGGRAILFARFAPILRTFAPFVAGLGKMSYGRFARYNIGGGVLWVSLFCGAGYVFGNIPAVKRSFHLVIIAIVVVSIIPAVVEALRARSAPDGAE